MVRQQVQMQFVNWEYVILPHVHIIICSLTPHQQVYCVPPHDLMCVYCIQSSLTNPKESVTYM